MSSKNPDNHDKQNTPKHKKKKDNDSDDGGEKEFNNEQFQEMLAGMFPSKHQKEKVKSIKDKKKKAKSNKSNKSNKSKKKKKKVKKESSDEEYNPEDDIPTTSDSELDRIYEEELDHLDEDYDDEDLDTEDEEELEEMRKGFQGMKFNIIFTDPRGGRNQYDEDYGEEEWLEEEEEEEEENI